MRWTAALLAFVYAAVISAVALGFALKGLGVSSAWVALALGLAAAGFTWRSTPAGDAAKLRFWDWVVLSIFALASLRAFLWVIFVTGDDIRVLSPNNLGDMSLHLNFIRYFASGIPFWPENPILTGGPLTYPLGVDLFNSLLEICGLDTIRGLVWVGLIGAGLTGYCLWRWGGAFGVAAFLFTGGLAGFVMLRTWEVADFQQDLTWKNLFLSMFVTQRGLLIALPAGLLVLHALRERWFRSGRQIIPLWLQYGLYAAMPLFNVHAFLFLSLILLAMFIAEKRTRRALFGFVLAAVIPATVGVFLVTGAFSADSGAGWAPTWVWGEKKWGELFAMWGVFGETVLPWLWNFGIAGPLIIALIIVLFFKKDQEARCFVWTSMLIFGLCCLFKFAPWAWDNMKLMMWCWLISAPYLWSCLIRRLAPAAQVVLCFALFFSGAVSLVGGLDRRDGHTIASRTELAAWKHAMRGIPAETRVACVPDFNHPVILLGRKVACGYEGHLWSHGLNFREKLGLLKSSLDGRIAWQESASKLDVGWLALRTKDIPFAVAPGEAPSSPALGALYDLELLKRNPASQSPQQLPRQSVGLSW